ncbi:MAG: nodulation protein NfeD [Cyclobacteriaceae bacterium]|nr:nodulation protein NfeD [Cyclobacteriaceae bacterium]MCB0498169.1 nodulation protein NfeD [Cyclobacteriaceae bacterium]MCB9238893.1 nodulation protein NfeD [Flammeovirgaceae bacterium]MCW5900947.1 nodulation protein NfeD [Cyclobacteriaceae bacterium]
MMVFSMLWGLGPQAALGQSRPKVMVMEIKAEIDPRMTRYVNLALDHAENIGADYVIVEMDTYGGVLTDSKDIVDRILDFEAPIWVFINKDAASAGALISIACDSIYMAPGATIGAATVVQGGTGEAAPDKYQSYMRSIMRSTAEHNGRDPRIAEGMVDERIAIDSITTEGSVITFTTKEALKYGYCEAQVSSIDDILQRNGVPDYELVRFEVGNVEKVIAFFLNPFISGILILVIMGGLYFELQTPGVGFPILASITALVLYLVPYYLNGLAQNWEIIALFVGIVLILLEVFVIPGFGLAGITGIAMTVGAMVLIMVNNDFFNFDMVPLNDIIVASLAIFGGLTGGVLLLFVGGVRLSHSGLFKRISLTDTQAQSEGYTSNFNTGMDLVGKTGTAYTVLRPSGKIMVEDQIYDAFSRGDYIEKGDTVKVLGIEGSTLKVRKVTA